jgi:hypothetical protein
MILRIIKQNSTWLLLIIPLVAFAFWGDELFNQHQGNLLKPAATSQLTGDFLRLLRSTGLNWLSPLVAVLVTVIQAFLVLKINSDFSFIDKRTFLPGFVYIIFANFYFAAHFLNGALLGNLFFLIAIVQFFDAHKEDPAYQFYFESSFYLAFSILFYPPFIVYVVFLMASALFSRLFKWREIVSTFIGLFATIWLYVGIFYVAGGNMSAMVKSYWDAFVLPNPLPKLVLADYVVFGYIIFVIALSSLHILLVYKYKKILIRRYFLLLFWIFLIACGAIFLIPSVSFEIFPAVFFPVSILVANYFTSMKYKWLSELIFYLLIVVIIWSQAFPYFTFATIWAWF